MNTQSQTVVHASDVTGQRHAQLTVPRRTLMGAVVAQAIGLMDLPTESATQERKPIIYHAYEDGASEQLLPEDIGRVAMVTKVADAVKVAMQRAGITDPADVHYVQTKTPLLTIHTIRDA